MKRFKFITLAVLMGLAACDSGTTTTPPAVTGTISGVVTLEGAGASGVTVTLSSGTTATTDASGQYTFSNVNAGAYTVTISGFASDATFDATAKAATVTTAGQVATVNFAGSYIKTSAIVGVVSAGGTALSGVTVSIGSSSTTTGTNGDYAFSGLRKGSYTVAISGYNATQYTFSATSATVTLGVGESKVQSFSGALVTTAKVSGRMFLDENNKDDTYTAGLEANLSIANVTITLEGGAVNNTVTTQTAADGTYSFSNLTAGTYRLTIDAASAALPTTVAYGMASTSQLVTVTAGASGSVNWPFDIIWQRVEAAAFLGTDADVSKTPGPGIRPLSGVKLDLFDTQANAAAGGATGRLGQATTGADGTVTFRFKRSADTSPSGPTDDIVFARFNSIAAANKTLNGENIIEIKYEPKDSSITSPDTFDILNTGIILKADAKEMSGTVLKGWADALYRNDTTTAAVALQTGVTNSSGVGRFVETTGLAALPDTFWIRLSQTQAGANGHGFAQTPMPDQGGMGGRWLMYVHDGTNPDSVMLGTESVSWTDADIMVRAHNERDDSMGGVPLFTKGDAVTNSTNLDVELFSVASDGTKTSVAGPFALAPATGDLKFGVNGVGGVIATGKTYEIRARSRVANQEVLTDTTFTIALPNTMQVDTAQPLKGSNGYSTFAWKYNDATITGTVRAADGTDADGTTVRVQSTADNIQPHAKTGAAVDTTITIVGGAYNLTGLREGGYTATAMEGDSSAVWQFLTKITGNTDAHSGTRDAQGATDNDIVNFRATRMDTKVQGVFVNDRDQDLTVIDPGESLSGAQVQLYRDGSGAITLDTLVATATSDANGAYSFTGLREGRYIAKWVAGTPNTDQDALRGLSKDTAVVTTAATLTGLGANNTRTVGVVPPATLPRWNYTLSQADGGFLPANFVFLYKNTVVKGVVQTAGAVGIPGMTVSLRRCEINTADTPAPNTLTAVSGPQAVTATTRCTTYLGTTVNLVTDADGAFQFSGLIEGVYEVSPQPGTVGGYTTSSPAQALYYTLGSADVETLTFTAS